MNEPSLPQIQPITNPQIKDRTGQRYGRLLAIGFVGTSTQGALWLCHCDCGKNIVARGNHLGYGGSQSCGCLKVEKSLAVVQTHGMYKSREYLCWMNMWRRCTYSKHKAFPDYGGRGIKVCERWEKFENFYADMGAKPDPKHSLDRIDVNGHYEPGNCRWATASDQLNNTRRNHTVEFRGESKTISEWAKAMNMSHETLRARLRLGWSIECALTTPVNKK